MWDKRDKHVLARLCGGWGGSYDAPLEKAVNYIEYLGAEVHADKTYFQRCKVTSTSIFIMGSPFYIRFPRILDTDNDYWIWGNGTSYPRAQVWWKSTESPRFEMTGEGLQEAVDWVLSKVGCDLEEKSQEIDEMTKIFYCKNTH